MENNTDKEKLQEFINNNLVWTYGDYKMTFENYKNIAEFYNFAINNKNEIEWGNIC